jgi:hypothetical protein
MICIIEGMSGLEDYVFKPFLDIMIVGRMTIFYKLCKIVYIIYIVYIYLFFRIL